MIEDQDLIRQSERSRRARRRKLNTKFKERDRHKPRRAIFLLPSPGNWRHDPFELSWQFNRRKAPPVTGYGVAWEHRNDVQ